MYLWCYLYSFFPAKYHMSSCLLKLKCFTHATPTLYDIYYMWILVKVLYIKKHSKFSNKIFCLSKNYFFPKFYTHPTKHCALCGTYLHQFSAVVQKIVFFYAFEKFARCKYSIIIKEMGAGTAPSTKDSFIKQHISTIALKSIIFNVLLSFFLYK